MKINFKELDDIEKGYLAQIPDSLIEKLQTMRDVELIQAITKKTEMTEFERVKIIARKEAYDNFLDEIAKYKEKYHIETQNNERKKLASKLKV